MSMVSVHGAGGLVSKGDRTEKHYERALPSILSPVGVWSPDLSLDVART